MDVTLPSTAPELLFGVNIYEEAIFKSGGVLYINDIHIVVEGSLVGAKILEVGKGGFLKIV